jgi:hypothetical protein
MGSSQRADSKRVRSQKVKSGPSNAQILFTLHFLLTQLQALRALAETGKELAEQDGGFSAPAIWDAISTCISGQMDVLSEMTVSWQS